MKSKNYSVFATAAIAAFSIISANAQTQLIQNGGFELGTTPWVLSGNLIWNLYNDAHLGSYYLWLGDDTGIDWAYQTVTIPSTSTAANLTFYYNINSSEPSSYGAYDTFSASILDASGNFLATVGNWSNLNGTSHGNPYYYQQTFDLLPYRGSTIRVYFSSSCHLSGTQTTNFRVDDVSVQVTTSLTKIIALSGNLAFGSVTVGSSPQSTLTINNSGNSTMTVSSIGYPSGFSGNWSGTIVAGGSQPVTVTFSPTSATSYGGTVTVNSDATSGVNTIAASGTGAVTPTRTISLSGNLTFGGVVVNSSAQSTLTIANTGNSTLTVSSISYPSGFSGNWSGTITAGSSQPVTVTFSPTSATSYGGTLTVNSDATSGVNTITASGTGTGSGTQPLGVDVSHHNGSVDWSQVRNSGGKTFALIHATSGINNVPDTQFPVNGANAKAAGLLVGAYHFAYPQYYTAHQEAQAFLAVAGAYVGTGYLPPTLDIEDSGGADNSYPYLLGKTVLSQWIRDWCAEVQQATGVTPMIYATRWYANNYFDANLNQYPFWVPTYSSAPTLPNSDPGNIAPWSTWTFQQYQTDPTTQGGGPGGTCPGISGYVDLDSFNGDLSALQALANQVPRVSRISGTAPRSGYTPTPVFIQRYPAGTTALIDPNLRTWILIHGRTDSSTAPWVSGTTGLAAAIAGIYPNDQILLLDWTDAAADTDFPSFSAEDWIKPVAAWAAGRLVEYGFAGSDLNLIGHSWGGSMTAEIAELIPYIRGHTVNFVNSIVALDPARDGTGSFNPDDPTADNGTPEIDFARNSRFSWAFHSSELGSGVTPPTAHEAFGVNTGGGPIDAHDWAHDVFIDMVKNANQVSQRFTLARLLDQSTGSRTLGPWDPDRYSVAFGIDPLVGGYEGVLTTTVGGQTPYSLTYYDKTTGLQVTEYAVVVPTRIISLGGSLAFGSVTVGSSPQSTLTINNTGNSTMTVSSISYPSGFSGNWSGTIAAGGSQPVTVTFSPTSAISYGGTVTVNSDATSGVNSIAASGTGTVTPTRIISLGGSLAFGSVTVGSSPQSTLTINNTGNSTMTVSSISYPSGFSGNWSGTIVAGGSQPVAVTFSPTSATSYGGTVTVNSDATSGVNSIAASGMGTVTPTGIISLSGDLAFGAVPIGSAVENLLTIRNSGTISLNVSNLNCPSGFSGSFSGTIAPGSFSYVLITFQPTLPASYGGAIVVTSDAGSGANVMAVSGIGTSTDQIHNPPIAVGAKTQPGDVLVLTWPTNAVGFQLEFTTNLGPSAIWTPVGTAATVVNGQNVLTNPATGQGMFFRLHQ